MPRFTNFAERLRAMPAPLSTSDSKGAVAEAPPPPTSAFPAPPSVCAPCLEQRYDVSAAKNSSAVTPPATAYLQRRDVSALRQRCGFELGIGCRTQQLALARREQTRAQHPAVAAEMAELGARERAVHPSPPARRRPATSNLHPPDRPSAWLRRTYGGRTGHRVPPDHVQERSGPSASATPATVTVARVHRRQ